MSDRIVACAIVWLAACGTKKEVPPPPPITPMVVIRAGRFLGTGLHCEPGTRDDRYPRGEPPNRAPMTLNAFAIDRAAVTCHEYELCYLAGACPEKLEYPPDTDTPRLDSGTTLNWGCLHGTVRASWHAAAQYCAWRHAQLPTFAQWQRAARGTDGRLEPPATAGPHGPFQKYTSPDGVQFEISGLCSEWTSDQDCLDGDYGPVAVPGFGSRLDQANVLTPNLALPFRCALSAQP